MLRSGCSFFLTAVNAGPCPDLPAHLCGRSLRGVMHACAFVDSREEQYRILLPYLQEGLACNAHLLTMVGQGHLRDHLERLRRAGMDPALLSATGRLAVTTSEETFPRNGSVTPTSILMHWERRIDEAQRRGFSEVRGFGEMDGALAALRRTEELLSARRVDGAQQFFTRAVDWGFSKNPEEAFTMWPPNQDCSASAERMFSPRKSLGPPVIFASPKLSFFSTRGSKPQPSP